MIPTVSKELRDLVERYQKQFPDQLADIDLPELIFVIVKMTRSLEMQPTFDGQDSTAVKIIRRALFSKLNLANLYKKDISSESTIPAKARKHD